MDCLHLIIYTNADGLAGMWTTTIAFEPDNAAWMASD
jgi:hypothetical protein